MVKIKLMKRRNFFMQEISQEEQQKVQNMINELVEKAKVASREYLKLDQETVDNITKAMSMAGLEHHMELAKMAVEETRKRNLRGQNNKEYVCNRVCVS